MAIEYTFTSTEVSKMTTANVTGECRGAVVTGKAIETNWYLYFDVAEGYEWSGVPQAQFNNGGVKSFVKYENRYYHIVENSTSRGGYKGFTYPTRKIVTANVIKTFNQNDLDTFTAANVSASINGVPVAVGTTLTDQHTLQLNALSGYLINSAMAFDTYGETNPFTVSSNGKQATLKTEWELTGFYIDSEAEPPFICLTVDQPLLDAIATGNSTGFINDIPMSIGDTVKLNDTIKFVAIDKYYYDGVNVSYGSNQVAQMIKSVDNLSCSLLWDRQEVINGFTFFTDTNYTPVYTFNVEKHQYFTDRNTKVFANDVELDSTSIIYRGDTIKIVCDPTYEFITGEPVRISSYDGFDMDLTEDRKTATYTWDEDISIYGFIFTTVKTAVVDTDTTNNTYQITPRELRNLESLNLKEFDVNGVEIADYSNLLVGVMRYPFAIPETLKGSYGGIYLGANQYEDVKATDILTDIIEIDLGEINCVSEFNDLRDYLNTEAILRLPHLSSVNLDLEYVIDQTIGVKYVVNLINGETTVIVTSSKLPSDNNTLLTLNATLGTAIPIAHKDGFNYKPIDTDNLRLGGINYISSPTIDIVRNEQVNGDSMFTIPVKDSGLLTGFTGWTKIDDIVFTVNATQQEKQEIIALLKSGVYFNDD